MPYWGQAAFGGIYFFAACIVSILLTVVVGPFSILFMLVLLFLIAHVHHNWKWPGFFVGILIILGLLFLIAVIAECGYLR